MNGDYRDLTGPVILPRPAPRGLTVRIMPPASQPEPAWTVEEAAQYFARAGIPVEPRRLALIIRALAITPVGSTRPGEKGGRGKALYATAELQALHRDLAEWLVRIPDPGPAGPADPAG